MNGIVMKRRTFHQPFMPLGVNLLSDEGNGQTGHRMTSPGRFILHSLDSVFLFFSLPGRYQDGKEINALSSKKIIEPQKVIPEKRAAQ